MPGQIIHENGHNGNNAHIAHHDHNIHSAKAHPLGCPFKIRSADFKLKPASTTRSTQEQHFLRTTPQQPLEDGFVTVSSHDGPSSTPSAAAVVEAPLGPLSAFVGKFQGIGFNTIFRPNSGPPVPEADRTIFPTAINPPAPNAPHEQTLELNLTTETLAFLPSLAQVPNRGLIKQGDIVLNGIPYEQRVFDVTNTATGKADGPPQPIHFENGLFMHVPASKTPNVGAYVILPWLYNPLLRQ